MVYEYTVPMYPDSAYHYLFKCIVRLIPFYKLNFPAYALDVSTAIQSDRLLTILIDFASMANNIF